MSLKASDRMDAEFSMFPATSIVDHSYYENSLLSL